MVSQRTPFLDALGEDVELAALFSEFGRRGIDPRPALSFARSSQELKTNLKTRLALPDSRAERGAAAEALQRETPHLSEPRGPRYQQFRESTPGMTPLEGAAFLSQMALSPVSIGLGAAGGYAGGAVGRQIGHERGGEQIGEILASLPGAAVSTTPHGIGQVAARALPKSGLGAARPGIAFRQGAGQLPGGVENIVEGVAAAGGVPVRAAIAGRGLAARGGGAVVRGVGQYAEEMGKSNVGNVLLPAAPETRALARAAGDVPDALPEIHPISTASINVDPGRFQFKGGVSSETGASKKLSGIRQFDPQAAGTITLWEDKAGKLFVVNGHHRVELAKRTRVPTMYAFIMREADGITEGQARAKGAIQNMQEGQGTPVDVAKFLRESNSNIESLKTRGVPVSERHVARGVALSQLDEGLFNRVAIGTLAEDAGVVIGEGLPGDFANQRAVADLVSGAKKQLTPAELKSLIQTAKGQNISVTQADMFGTTTVQKSTLIAQAKIGAWLEDQLSGDLKVFNYVTRAGRPERLARGETVVNVTRGQEMAQQSGTMLEIFRVKAHAVGKINDIVRESAEQAMQGGDEKLIRQTALDRIREAITSGDALRAEGPSNILGSPASRPPSVAPEASAPAGRGGQVGFGIGEQPQAGSLFGMAPDDIPIASQADLVLQNELAKAEAHRLRGMGQSEIAVPPQPEARAAGEVLEGIAASTPQRTFYRGTTPGDTRRIDEPFIAAKGKTFVARTQDAAKSYGSQLETITAKSSAKILNEEDPAFWTLLRRKRPPNGSVFSAVRPGEKPIDLINEAIRRSEGAGYDILSFSRDADVGTIILNDNAVVRAARPPDVTPPPASAAQIAPVKQIVTPGEARGVAATVDTTGAEAHRLRGMGQQTIPQTPEEAAALANASGPSTLADRVENATLTQKAVPAAAESFQPAPPQSTYLPIPKTVEEADALYPRVTGTSDGRIVRKGVPNTASIRAGFNDGEFEELRGIRDIPVAEFGLTGKSYSVSETRRIAELAEQIKASGEINPLIVAVDNEGLSIVEGMHRAEALYLLKAKSFPAVVIVDTSANAGVGALKEGIDAVPLSGQPALSAPAVPSTPAGGTIFTPPASVPNVHIPTQTQGPTQLPRDLAGAKPRGPGGKATLSFDSDVDKALYIIGNPATRSKAHDAYVGWLEAQFPGTDVASAGQRVRAFVAQAGRGGSAGNIRIPDTGITPRPPTRVIEGVTYPSSENVPAGGDIITDTGMIRPPPKPPSGSAALPVEPRRPDIEFPGMERPALGQNLYGLKEIKTGMTRGNKIENAVLGPMQKFNRAGKLAFHQNTPEGAAVNRARAEAKPIIASQSTQLSQRQAVAVRKAFPDLEEDAFVPSLAGKVARVKGTPGLQDIRDFYPDYEPLLTAQQKAALDPIVKTHAEIKGLLNRLGIPIGSRASTQIGGGHYIARVSQGMLKPEDIRGVPTRGLFASQKKGFEREIKFLTMAEGRAAGVKYAGIEDALKAHYQQAGERALEKHVANYLTTAVDETNWPISVPRAGDMARGPVDLPVLAEYEFPEAIAESINKVLRNEGATVGAGSSAMEAVRILNRGYRSLRASLDNSVMGIQGLLSAYAHPIAAAKAAKLNFQSWTDKNVLARFMDNFDSGAAREGRLNSSQWVSEGTLHLGATTGEFGIEGLQKLPGFKQAGRAFGYTGDGLRLQVADALLEQEMSGYSVFGIAKIGKGRTLDEIRASGDLAKIGEIANNMTGVAKKRFGGDVGEILLFAPRFLQSRLETVGKGLISLRPGASIEQKIARRSLLKMIAIGTGLTVAINELNGEDTDFRPIVNGKKNPNFMRVRAFGRDWSLFGTWDSLLRLFIAAGHGDVEAAVRSQASGITTGVFDLLIADADFVGRSTISIENKIRWAGRQFAPFSGEQSAEGIGQIASGKPGDIASGTVAAASSFSGGKSSPVGFTDHADEIARQQYGTTWADMQAQRDAAEDKMVSAGNASSPEYNDIDARMDAIAKIVTKQFPNDLGGGVTLDAKRENLARQLYHRTYGELYVSQKASINKRILGITGQEFKFNINR